MVAAAGLDLAVLRCPASGGRLRLDGAGQLVSEDGTKRYPIVGGVPILINENNSVFRVCDYIGQPPPSFLSRAARRLRGAFVSSLPSLTRNVGSRENFLALAGLMRADGGSAPFRVLVVGGATAGVGFNALSNDAETECTETDVTFSERTQIICDAHDLPFAAATFDAVVCQAVLEHVLDPFRVVAEIHRVLRRTGLVYSEIPFMQQVHGGKYDVTRFTLLGHRRLYRYFDEIRSGAQGGPGMALGWSLWYFLRALAPGRGGRALAAVGARLAFFWLKYVDDLIVEKPAALDAASGTFFLGRRRIDAVSDADVLDSYRGASGSGWSARKAAEPQLVPRADVTPAPSVT